jgi:very-short-patch-repair endonuclease
MTPHIGTNRRHGSAAGELLMLQLRGLKVAGWVAEYRFHATRRWRFDVAFPAPEHRLAIEVDGGGFVAGRHTRGLGVESDCEKFCAAVIDGWRVMRVTPRQVRSGEAVRWVLDALASRESVA